MPSPQDSILTYDDYVGRFKEQFSNNSEGGTPTPLSETEWTALPPQERWATVQWGLFILPGDPRYEALAQQTGAEEGRVVQVRYTPKFDARNFELVDPTKLVQNDEIIAWAANNETPGMQRGNEQRWNYFALAAPIVTAGIASGLGMAGAAPTGVDTLAAAPGQGFGTASAGGAASAGAQAGGAAGALGGDSPVGTEIPNSYTPGADPTQYYVPGGTEAAPPPGGLGDTGSPGWASEGGAPVQSATQPPAPVTNAGAAPVTDISTPAQGNGIINGARGAYNSVSGWYNSLSPASRMILGTAVSQGANALARGNAQREAADAADERERTQRDDRVRRTGVPNFGSAFTPKPGIIDSRRSGG